MSQNKHLLPFQREPQIPPGTKKIIIFDTNAYRVLTQNLSLTDSRAETLRLRKLEQTAGYFALANPVVIWELVGHLGDTSDPAYNHCLNGLLALAEHTWSPFDPNAGVCLFADATSTVCRQLFGVVPPIAKENVQNLSKLTSYVKMNAPDLTLPAALTNLKAFSQKLNDLEVKWVGNMQKVLNDCDPTIARPWVGGKDDKETRRKLRSFFGSQVFMDSWAALKVVDYANLVGKKLTAAELNEKAIIMKQIFPVSFLLLAALLQKFPSPQPILLNSRKKKRANYMCDSEICFSIGTFHGIDDAPMFLVTGDKAIKEAATKAGCSNRVVALPDYLRGVGF